MKCLNHETKHDITDLVVYSARAALRQVKTLDLAKSTLLFQCLACSAKTLATQKLKKLSRQLFKEWKLSLTQGNFYKCLEAHLLGYEVIWVVPWPNEALTYL